MSEFENDFNTAILPAPTAPRVRRLPPWKVLLHNDNVNDMHYVIEAIVELTPLAAEDATVCMLEAHQEGVACLMATHREHAELVQEQFQSKLLTVSIERE
jgi:ATP-dependent Clp protease adaptor protein ClpS